MGKISHGLRRVAKACGLRRSHLDAPLAVVSRVIAPVVKTYASHPGLLPITNAVWERQGVVPMTFQYYSPLYRAADLPAGVWSTPSSLAGIDMRLDEQVELLASLATFAEEVADTPSSAVNGSLDYFVDNPAFGPGDAEMLYAMVRHTRPERVLEVGSGHSTRLVRQALRRNAGEGAAGVHVCIEPYENDWLGALGLDRLVRQKVEDVGMDEFESLHANDVLFIDSSHVVRTGGDVAHLYLEVLPRLAPGVIVHAHDIFLPFAYPREWSEQLRYFWSEQHLLQAFLAFNREFEPVLSLAYLMHVNPTALLAACPILRKKSSSPGSFWLRRRAAQGAGS